MDGDHSAEPARQPTRLEMLADIVCQPLWAGFSECRYPPLLAPTIRLLGKALEQPENAEIFVADHIKVTTSLTPTHAQLWCFHCCSVRVAERCSVTLARAMSIKRTSHRRPPRSWLHLDAEQVGGVGITAFIRLAVNAPSATDQPGPCRSRWRCSRDDACRLGGTAR